MIPSVAMDTRATNILVVTPFSANLHLRLFFVQQHNPSAFINMYPMTTAEFTTEFHIMGMVARELATTGISKNINHADHTVSTYGAFIMHPLRISI